MSITREITNTFTKNNRLFSTEIVTYEDGKLINKSLIENQAMLEATEVADKLSIHDIAGMYGARIPVLSTVQFDNTFIETIEYTNAHGYEFVNCINNYNADRLTFSAHKFREAFPNIDTEMRCAFKNFSYKYDDNGTNKTCYMTSNIYKYEEENREIILQILAYDEEEFEFHPFKYDIVIGYIFREGTASYKISDIDLEDDSTPEIFRRILTSCIAENKFVDSLEDVVSAEDLDTIVNTYDKFALHVRFINSEQQEVLYYRYDNEEPYYIISLDESTEFRVQGSINKEIENTVLISIDVMNKFFDIIKDVVTKEK